MHSAVMSGDRSMVEELLKRGADQSLKATKKDVQGGAELTPHELALATKFKHISVFKKRAASPSPPYTRNHNLGRADIASSNPRTGCRIADVKVSVTRQDTGRSEGSMMNEFSTFLKTNFKEFDSEHLKFPPGFTYDRRRMADVDGPTDVTGRQIGRRTEDRDREVQSRRGEEMLDDALHKAFSKRTSMMWNGFEQDTLFKIAKDCVRHDLEKARAKESSLLDVPLLPEERALQELFGINVTQLEKEVEEFVKEIFSGNQDMTEGDLDKAIDDKCKNPKKAQNRKEIRPVFEFFSQKEKTYYRDNLKRHVKKAFITNSKKGKKGTTKNITSVKPAEFGHYIIRYFMSLLVKQAEFDHILVDKDSSSLIQVEVKTYPLQGVITKEGMKEPFASANTQLGWGDSVFQNILRPNAQLGSSWTKINIMCFPHVKNRQEFRDHLEEPIEAEFLKYVLTKEELGNNQWLNDLQLGTLKAPNEEYERLLAIIIGSAYVGYNSQIFDYQKEIRKVHERIVGARSGVTILPDSLPEQFSGSDLQKKPLGHVMNIIFWSEEQMQLLEDLKCPGSLVLCGDYGGGKTSVMVSAAQRAAREGFKVFVITTTSFEEAVDTSYILDVAMKEKFEKMVWDEEVDLTVTSLMDIHKELGLPFNSSASDLITKFMEVVGHREKVKVFFDEFPVTKEDLEAVKNNEEGELTRMLKAIDEKSYQAYVSLKTTCLLDTVFAPGPKTKTMREVGANISTKDLKSYIENQTNCKVKVLSKRMRNTSKIGKAVVANMEDYALKHEGTFPVACVLEAGNSNHTVPGERPHCVVGELGGYTPCMDNITMCLWASLTQLLRLPLSGDPAQKLPAHIAILCGDNIQPREVWKRIDYLNIKPCLYDGGVKMYSYATAHHYTDSENQDHPTAQQRTDLIQWMEGPGGILVTHNRLFAGMEAPTVVLITKTLGTNETAVRSGMLRAVAKLVVISDKRDTNIKMVEKHFDVIEMEDANAMETS